MRVSFQVLSPIGGMAASVFEYTVCVPMFRMFFGPIGGIAVPVFGHMCVNLQIHDPILVMAASDSGSVCKCSKS